jgi:hypothetical protein
MKRGDVLVNNSIVSPDYILKGGESLRSNNCHRHGMLSSLVQHALVERSSTNIIS